METIIFNPVVIAVAAVLGMCLMRVNVVIALASSAVICGVIGGNSPKETIGIFSAGLKDGSKIALSYAMLGAFASALAHSGLPNFLTKKVVDALCLKRSPNDGDSAVEATNFHIKIILLLVIGMMSIACKNIVPVHIAFIPILIPPLLGLFNQVKLDRRAVACVITFGLISAYMLIPFGVGAIYLNDILVHNLKENGINMSLMEVIRSLAFPAGGMFVGLLIALARYRRPREYKSEDAKLSDANTEISPIKIAISTISVIAVFIIQIKYNEIILSALSGFIILSLGGAIEHKKSDNVVSGGIKMMAAISFILMAAHGFGTVLKTVKVAPDMTAVSELVNWVRLNTFGSKPLAALGMLVIGLFVSIGIGSSFATVPIIASVYAPLGLDLGFSPSAIAILIATSGVIGDAGSPASDSTLGPTMGLNADGQHSLVRDSSIPTFLHLSIPAFISGWLAAVLL